MLILNIISNESFTSLVKITMKSLRYSDNGDFIKTWWGSKFCFPWLMSYICDSYTFEIKQIVKDFWWKQPTRCLTWIAKVFVCKLFITIYISYHLIHIHNFRMFTVPTVVLPNPTENLWNSKVKSKTWDNLQNSIIV